MLTLVDAVAVEPLAAETVARARLGRDFAAGWVLREVLGVGGTAAVYSAEHADGRTGAVKVIHSHLAGDRDWVRRLHREASVLRLASHPGLARLLDIGMLEDGAPFLVMERLEGCSLEALRKRAGGALPVEVVLGYACDVLEALSYTHALGVVHRDIKPSNLFLTTAGTIKVLDFGIASNPTRETREPTHTSATRGILGTPAYMAPEQALGRWELVNERSDLWAVGATIFTLLSGQYVHVARTENERLGRAMSRQARSLGAALPGFDPRVVEVVDRALAYDTARRFPSADAFREALRAVTLRPIRAPLAERATIKEAPPALRPRRPRRPALAAALSGPLFVGLGFAAVSGDPIVRPSPTQGVPTEEPVLPVGTGAQLKRTPTAIVSHSEHRQPAGTSTPGRLSAAAAVPGQKQRRRTSLLPREPVRQSTQTVDAGPADVDLFDQRGASRSSRGNSEDDLLDGRE